MPSPRIVNIVNFIRAVEPRDAERDLVLPLRRQLALGRQHRLPTTWLLQYDALMDDRFYGLIRKEAGPDDEVGIWFEVVQPLVEQAGLRWRGRYPWDWHSNVGFSIGYTPAERERLADVFMAEFMKRFGCHPRSMGSWFFDAHLLGYLADRYHIQQACNCKDQWGTDGYSLWGGYYNQAYYPSRCNAFMPAQTRKNQINVPVFRMLGSDPIYQYDCGHGGAKQGVISLEPAYIEGGGGGHPPWVRWFMDQLCQTPCLAFAYAQAGQENAFGWPSMQAGLTDQYALFERLRSDGLIRIETMEATGAWFKSHYPSTPATAFVALDDWKHEGRKSMWFDSRNYRINLLWENGELWIRDWHVFDETYAERYLTEVCTTPNCLYDTLPIIDGNLWAKGQERAGLRFVQASPAHMLEPLRGGDPMVSESGRAAVRVAWPLKNGARMEILLAEKGIKIKARGLDWGLQGSGLDIGQLTISKVRPGRMDFVHAGHRFALACKRGALADALKAPHLFARSASGHMEFGLFG